MVAALRSKKTEPYQPGFWIKNRNQRAELFAKGGEGRIKISALRVGVHVPVLS